VQLYAFMTASYIVPVALVATGLWLILRLVRRTAPRWIKWISVLSWVSILTCIAFIFIAELVIGRWRVRSESLSPDGRSIARVESQHSAFFDQYEVNFRFQIRGAPDGPVVSEAVSWEIDVVDHPWDVPDAAVSWSPDSAEAVMTVHGTRTVLRR
jgi:hypothetical protein